MTTKHNTDRHHNTYPWSSYQQHDRWVIWFHRMQRRQAARANETGRRIAETIMRRQQVTQDEISSQCRDRRLAYTRQLISYFCRKYTLMSYPEIGRLINRNHTTVIHGENTIHTLIGVDRLVKGDVESITRLINRI